MDKSKHAMPPSARRETASPGQRLLAYSVHLYTASGIVFAFLAIAELYQQRPEPRWVFVWLIIAVFIDSTDGPLARRWQVKTRVPQIAGRTIDDIVDYLTFTFIPLLLVWRLQWLPAPAALWVVPAMVASLLGFANTEAKQEEEGFFRGFPSYWNFVAFYICVAYTHYGPEIPAVIMVVLTLLTLLPVRFLYPNLAPRPWRWSLIAGAGAWLIVLLWCLPIYPRMPAWLLWLSLAYPAWYTGLSIYLDIRSRLRQRKSRSLSPGSL
jgi:phosphatidylcholine synthase